MRARISNEGSGPTRVDVFDDIGDGGWYGEGLTAKDFTAQLAGVKGPLDVHINSSGGAVGDGIAIANAVRAHPGRKRTIVDGMAASIASIIMQAGDERIVEPGSMVMIHDASTAAAGTASDFEKMAADLNKHSDNLAKQYADRAGGTPEQWRSTMKAETWFSADEAVAAGLADRVGVGTAALPKSFDLAAFHAVPGRIVAHLRSMPTLELPAVAPVEAAAVAPVANAYQPQPYEREDWENVLCPVCGKYNDDDGIYCGQCGVMLAGRDDVHGAPSEPDDGDGEGDAMAHAARTLVAAGLTADHVLAFVNAAVDESDWDGDHAMSLAAKSDDPAATYKQICAGRREGDPSKQESWALPYKYPGKGPNAAGVKAALGRLTQTQGLTNEAEAKSLLQRLMKQVNPDYEPDNHAALPAWLTNHDQTPPLPAWLQPAQEAK
jgi:ATP-dependent protease ClpP protease subunit